MVINKHDVAIIIALFVGIFACVAISCIATTLGGYGTYFYDEDIARNPLVASARILGSEFDMPSDRFDVEINTVSGYSICLHYVHRSCRNREISVEIINDIQWSF